MFEVIDGLKRESSAERGAKHGAAVHDALSSAGRSAQHAGSIALRAGSSALGYIGAFARGVVRGRGQQ